MWARCLAPFAGTLWNNIVTIDNLLIANTASNPTAVDPLHDDNFTVVVAQLVSGDLTAPCRLGRPGRTHTQPWRAAWCSMQAAV